MKLASLALLSLFAFAVADPQWISACVDTSAVGLRLVSRAGNLLNTTTGCLAAALFDDAIASSGWARLTVTTSPFADDLSQAYAGGWIEGYLTSTRIIQSKQSFFAATYGNATSLIPPQSLLYLHRNIDWVRSTMSSKGIKTWALDEALLLYAPDTGAVPAAAPPVPSGASKPIDPTSVTAYWSAVAAMYAQLRGMHAESQNNITFPCSDSALWNSQDSMRAAFPSVTAPPRRGSSCWL
jgi:hypothetical protein